MKAKDVVNQLALILPQVSDRFTTNINISALTRSGFTATAATAIAHNLSTGQQINITGAKTPISINSLTRVLEVGTLVTATPHDITENYIASVELSGAVEAEFNGSFIIVSVPDRNTINFVMAYAGPTVATGAPLLINGSSALNRYNGLYEVSSIIDPNTFTYTLTNDGLFTPASGTIVARTNPRISAGVTPERVLDSYTKQLPDDLWAFVVLDDVFASKSRNIESDAVDNIQRGSEWRQQTIHPFSVIVIFPATNEIAARDARDDTQDVFRELCQSLLGHKLDSGLYIGAQNPIQFLDHGFLAYSTAFYAHTFNFQSVADILFEDTVGYSLDVAFRDIRLEMGVDVGTAALIADLNLDDVV